mgnify:CR=1 FL=1
MVFEDINWLDPGTWLWASVIVIVLTFIAIYFKIFLGKREP